MAKKTLFIPSLGCVGIEDTCWRFKHRVYILGRMDLVCRGLRVGSFFILLSTFVTVIQERDGYLLSYVETGRKFFLELEVRLERERNHRILINGNAFLNAHTMEIQIIIKFTLIYNQLPSFFFLKGSFEFWNVLDLH